MEFPTGTTHGVMDMQQVNKLVFCNFWGKFLLVTERHQAEYST